MNTYQYQSRNQIKTIVLITVMTTLVISLGFAFSTIYKSPIFLIVALIGALVQGLISYYSGEKLAIASAGGVLVTESSHPVLYNLVDDIARISGVKMPDLYVSPDPSANAFACGLGPNRSSICVNQGLLQLLNKPELEGVLAHEMAHIKNRDIQVMTVAFVMTALISILVDLGSRMSFYGSMRDSEDNKGNGIAMIFLLICFILAPIAGTILVMSVSRSREYLADASAVELTRYPEGLISALQKLHQSPIASEHYSSATNHFFIAPPKQNYNQKFNDNWFSTHPSLENRIKNLLDQDGRLGRDGVL
jgi:heat shock protein HtpX